MVRHYPLRKPHFFIFSTLKCAAGRKFGRHFGRGRGVQSAVSVWPASCFLNSERLDDQFGTSSKIMNSNVEITLLSCAHRRIRKRFGTFQSLGRKAVFHFAETQDEEVGLRHETRLKVLRGQFSFLTYSWTGKTQIFLSCTFFAWTRELQRKISTVCQPSRHLRGVKYVTMRVEPISSAISVSVVSPLSLNFHLFNFVMSV